MRWALRSRLRLAPRSRSFRSDLHGAEHADHFHGLANENTRDALDDYFTLGVQWKLLRNMPTFGPVAMALTTRR
jgi:hypothetical protein